MPAAPAERAPEAGARAAPPAGDEVAQAAPPRPGPAAPPPKLDLPTEFRAAAAAPPRAPSPAAPVLDLPTEFRAAVAPPGPVPHPAGTSAPLGPRTDLRAAAAPDRAAGASEVERLVSTFAESYLPASVRIGGFEDARAFLGKVAEALEAFARAFVEIRKGYEEFGKQMGIRAFHGEGPVQRARDARQLMAALLDPGQQGRAAELQAAFADYMVHQVALLNGVREGAKAMLARVGPEEIEAQAPKLVWPLKAQTLWKVFEERFHELLDEDGALSEALFGREFAQAYTAIVGGRSATEREDEDDGPDDRDAGGRGRSRAAPTPRPRGRRR